MLIEGKLKLVSKFWHVEHVSRLVLLTPLASFVLKSAIQCIGGGQLINVSGDVAIECLKMKHISTDYGSSEGKLYSIYRIINYYLLIQPLLLLSHNSAGVAFAKATVMH